MDLNHLPKQLIDKIVNLGGTEKQLICLKCQKITKQVSISYSEMNADESILGDIFLSINNFNPASVVLLGNPFVCTVCGKVKLDGGLLSTAMNKIPRND